MTPDALRQTLEAEREALGSLGDALHDHVRLILDAGGTWEQPTVMRLNRIAGSVDRARVALGQALDEVAGTEPDREPDLENDTWQTRAQTDELFGPGREP